MKNLYILTLFLFTMPVFSYLNKDNKTYTTDEVGDYVVNFIKNS